MCLDFRVMESPMLAALKFDLARAKGYWPRLAEQTQIDHSTIARIARGDTPSPQIDTFQKIRDWLDVNLPMIEALASDARVDATPQQAAYSGNQRRGQQG